MAVLRRQSASDLVVVSICRNFLDLQLQSQFMTARNNSRMHLPFFCKSLSECEYIFGITITVLEISQNNDNKGCHLEFYFHTGFSASQFTPVSI